MPGAGPGLLIIILYLPEPAPVQARRVLLI